MKAEELMVGDWVMPLKKKLKGIPGKVVTIDGGTNVCWIDSKDYSCLVQCSDVEGIPITPEILEKNGFIYKDAAHNNFRGVWVCNVGRCNNVFIQFTDKVAIEIHNELGRKDEKGRADLVSFCRDWCEVLFVHELQHALRICGIDKTIEL